MQRLNQKNLDKLAKGVHRFSYDRDRITSAIVHFGVGNFHRAHQAIYCDNLLNSGQTQWGIIGVSMRSSNVSNALMPQDGLYTELTLGAEPHFRIIGSLTRIIVAPKEPQAVIAQVAHADTQLVTVTITEKGYYLASGKLDRNHLDLASDLSSLDTPKTLYGFLTAALIERCHSNALPITIMCCDNIQGGGKHIDIGVETLLLIHGPDCADWVKSNVSFISSMVDRVTPMSDDALKQRVAHEIELEDHWPISAEPFSQWVIEDNFAGQRPPFDTIGALFVNDVSAYERMKLRFLNAGHSIVATLGYLLGDQYVHQTLKRQEVRSFVELALSRDILNVVITPAEADAKQYIADVLQRFHNHRLPYANLQVGTDSSQKIQQRWLPTVDEAITRDITTPFLAFSIAAWVHYIHRALAGNALVDPKRDAFNKVNENNLVIDTLDVAGAQQFGFRQHQPFIRAVKNHHHQIASIGIAPAITAFLDKHNN